MQDDTLPPPDEYLSQTELLQLRGILRERASKLLDRSRETVNELIDVNTPDPDAVDQAANDSDRGFSLRMAQRDREMLSKIRQALGRIAEGEYGTCEICGGPISYKRLLARPVATACIDCKTAAEQKEGRRWES